MTINRSNAIRDTEQRGIGQDDQQLAEIRALLSTLLADRTKMSAKIRLLRQLEREIVERRVLSDANV